MHRSVVGAGRGRARRRAATPERADLLGGRGLWHTADLERETEPAAAAELARQGAVEATTTEETEPDRLAEPVPGSGAEEAAALTPQEQPEPERGEVENFPAEKPGLEPQEPPPPAGEERGWYPDPRGGVHRYRDGHGWTGHVWGGRAQGSARASLAAAADADQASAVPAASRPPGVSHCTERSA